MGRQGRLRGGSVGYPVFAGHHLYFDPYPIDRPAFLTQTGLQFRQHLTNTRGQRRIGHGDMQLAVAQLQYPAGGKYPGQEPPGVGLFQGMYFHTGAAGETVPNVFRVSAVLNEVLA